MSRVGVPAAILVLLALFAAPQFGAPDAASADSSIGSQMTLIMADGEAIRRADGGVQLVQSLVGLVATLRDDQYIAFTTAEDSTSLVGPFRGSNVRLPEFVGQIEAMLDTPTQRSRSLLEAVSEALALLTVREAAPGSSVYLVAGGSTDADFTRHASHLPALAAAFAANGWHVDGLALSGSTEDAVAFLRSLATDSGGRLFDLSEASGLGPVGDAILRHDAEGSLSAIGSRSLRYGEVMSTLVTILPGTRQATFLIFKSNPFGSLVLTSPSGFNVSANDLTNYRVVETPHMVAWRLVDPTPGTWRVDARGLIGQVSKWVHQTNRFSLVLRSSGPVALGEPVSITAYVKDGAGTAVLEDVRLFANITAPDGTTRVFELRDDGTRGDGVPGDGYFSIIMPPLQARGTYDVELELSWDRYKHTITSLSQLYADSFPAIDVQRVAIDQVVPGERTMVATVSVHVDGDPYPVEEDTLVASLVSEAGRSGVVELEPRRLYGNGPAWQFDVFFTTQEAGRHALSLTLSLSYAGRIHTQTSSPFTLDAVSPAVAEVITASEPATVRTIDPAPRPVTSVVPAPTRDSGFSWGLAVTLALMLAVPGAAAGYWLTRTRPHGYLYDDRGTPLVDFSQVQRHPLLDLFFRSTVRGSELGVPALDGLLFQFSGDQIVIRGYGEHPTVRVNNQPLVTEASVYDKTWIGTEGKLFTFLRRPLALPAGGSDD